MKRVKDRKIKKIFVHVTDSDDSLDIGFAEINEWHKERGWLSPSGISCGYHYIILRSGRIELGRPLEEVGAHVYKHNRDSIGIVWVGRNQIDKRQYDMLLQLLRTLLNNYNLKEDDVFGHNEFDFGKTCPNIDMLKLRGDLIFQRDTIIEDEVCK